MRWSDLWWHHQTAVLHKCNIKKIVIGVLIGKQGEKIYGKKYMYNMAKQDCLKKHEQPVCLHGHTLVSFSALMYKYSCTF